MSNMLHEQEFVEVGFIRKASGFKGAVKVVINEAFLEDVRKARFIFIDIDTFKIPYKIDSFKEAHDTVMELRYLESREEVRSFAQKPLWLLRRDIHQASEALKKVAQIQAWSGRMVIDKTLGELGVIDRIEEFPQQWMLVIPRSDGTEALIPVVDPFIERIEDKHIYVDLPAGLW